MVKTAWLIRHGESTSNAGFSTANPGEATLTDKGRQQAELVSQAITDRPDLVATSPYIRTIQSAHPTITRFEPVALAQWQIQEFTYLEPTNWVGSTMKDRLPAVIKYWEMADPQYHDGPGAESFVDFMARVDQLHERLEDLRLDFVVIFSHGLFSRGFLWRRLNRLKKIDTEFMHQFNFFYRSLNFHNCAILKLSSHDGVAWNSPIELSHIPKELQTI